MTQRLRLGPNTKFCYTSLVIKKKKKEPNKSTSTIKAFQSFHTRIFLQIKKQLRSTSNFIVSHLFTFRNMISVISTCFFFATVRLKLEDRWKIGGISEDQLDSQWKCNWNHPLRKGKWTGKHRHKVLCPKELKINICVDVRFLRREEFKHVLSTWDQIRNLDEFWIICIKICLLK